MYNQYQAYSVLNEGPRFNKLSLSPSTSSTSSETLGLIERVAANILPTVDEGPELALADMTEVSLDHVMRSKLNQGSRTRFPLTASKASTVTNAGITSCLVTLRFHHL